ncbi:MAG TPA: serine hydrolase [Acidobacteriaceae bacterium]|nr:serine hydrolase [Acidobacteriaceae bacterium]
MRIIRFIFLICLLVLGLQAGAIAQTKSNVTEGSVALDHQIQEAIKGFPGQVSLYAKNLDTGASYSLRADDPVPTASTIKVPIMVELFAEAQERKLDWNQKLELTDEDKVSGSGILTEFSGGDLFPIRDLMHVMIVVSDNTATNMILGRIGGDAVNHRMTELGLKQTAVMRQIMQPKIFPNAKTRLEPQGVTAEGRKPGNEKWGTGRSCPRDMVILMEKLYRGELVSKDASQEMLRVMKRQRDLQGVGRDMKNTVVASKSGALDHLRSSVALVYSKNGPVAISITVNGIPEVDYGVDNPGNLLIAKISSILVEELAPAP